MKGIDFEAHNPVPLKAIGTWPDAVHLFDEQSALALNAALATGSPLLVRGLPGVGKSQLARAAAVVLKRRLVSVVVDSRSQAEDLFYHLDAVARLAEAQTLGGACSPEQVAERLDHRRFVSPGPLWWTFDPETAQQQYQEFPEYNRPAPDTPEDWKLKDGMVLLIDEIDKADADLPNGLLEALGNGRFNVPWLDQPIGLRADMPAPLIIVTTNEERELPPAFLRRCLVLPLQLPEEKHAFIELLSQRAKAHFGKVQCPPAIREEAARQLWDDRLAADEQGDPLPGQAEYLNLLQAVLELAENEDEQQRLLKRLSGFSYKKSG